MVSEHEDNKHSWTERNNERMNTPEQLTTGIKNQMRKNPTNMNERAQRQAKEDKHKLKKENTGLIMISVTSLEWLII